MYVFGNYDQRVLNDVAKRYKLPKIKLIDYSDVLLKKICKKNDYNHSLKSFMFALNIKLDNFIEHNPLWDAKLLFEIYKKINSLSDDDIIKLENKLKIEMLRPKRNAQDGSDKYIDTPIHDNFNISILKLIKHDKKIEKFCIDEDIDHFVEFILEPEKTQIEYTCFNNSGEQISCKSTFIHKNKKDIKYKDFYKIKNELNIDFHNNVLICEKSFRPFFKEKINKERIFNVAYWIPIVSLKNFETNTICKMINLFYEDKKFDLYINYDFLNLLS